MSGMGRLHSGHSRAGQSTIGAGCCFIIILSGAAGAGVHPVPTSLTAWCSAAAPYPWNAQEPPLPGDHRSLERIAFLPWCARLRRRLVRAEVVRHLRLALLQSIEDPLEVDEVLAGRHQESAA